jgi:hypothetical protein
MNTNETPTNAPLCIFVAKDGQTLGPLSLEDVRSMRRKKELAGEDPAWTTEESERSPLKDIISRIGRATKGPPVSVRPRPKKKIASPAKASGGDPFQIVSQPIKSRADAETYIGLASAIYGIIVILDLYVGLVPMGMTIAVLTFCLFLLHSRVAAGVLLVLSGIEAIASLNGYWMLALISIIQVAITARALEATIKIQNNTFAPRHKQRALEKTRTPKD